MNEFNFERSQLSRLPQNADGYLVQIISDGGPGTKWLSINARQFRAISLILTGETEEPLLPYVVQYRDASGWRWEDLDSHRYAARGMALIARDDLIEDEPRDLPPNRHRVVDLRDGVIVEWATESVDR